MCTCEYCYTQHDVIPALWLAIGGGVIICDSCQAKAINAGKSFTDLTPGCYAGMRDDPRETLDLQLTETGDKVTYTYGVVELTHDVSNGLTALSIDGQNVICTNESLRTLRSMIDQLEQHTNGVPTTKRSVLLERAGISAEPAPIL
jgi:hypothetical protein